jgi:hypothetical protein
MSNYSTPYKSGTFDGVPSSTTFSVQGLTPTSTDVGRLIIITSGSGKLQHREITAVSNSSITIAHAWDTNAFVDPSLDQRAKDVLPASGDEFSLSYDVGDLVNSDADIVKINNNQLKLSGTLNVKGGAYLHFKNFHIEFLSSDIEIEQGGGIIFGYYQYVENEDGYFVDPCNITDIVSGFGGNQMRFGNTSFGLLDMYGGNIFVAASAGCLWRLYENSGADPDDTQSRLVGVTIDGSFAARIDGSRSIVDVTLKDVGSYYAPINTLTAVGRYQVSAFRSTSAVYVQRQFGPSGRATIRRMAELTRSVVFNSNVGGGVFEIVAKKSEIDLQPVFLNSDASGTDGHIMRYGNLVYPSYVDKSNQLVTDSIATKLLDTNGTIVNSENVTTGKYTEFFVRHTDVTTVKGNSNLSDGTQYAPYSLRSLTYDKLLTTMSIDAEDTFNPAIVLLDDLVLTESNKAIVDTYTEIDTPQKFYDKAKAYLVDNYAGEASTLVARSGNEIDLGSYNLVIDSGASSVFAFDGTTITIKASTFIGNLTTSGLVTLANGAVVLGTITDANGSRATLQYSISGLIQHSRVQIYNVTTDAEIFNGSVNATTYSSQYTEGTEVTSGDEIRLRVTRQNGVTAYLPFTATAIATASGFSLKASQEADAVYNANAIDGSLVSTLTADFPNVQVDVDDADGLCDVREIYARYVNIITTKEGIRQWFSGITAINAVNYQVNTAVNDLTIQNVGTNGVNLGVARIFRDDGAIILAQGNAPITQDNGEFVQFIQPQLDSAMNTNAKLDGVSKNTNLIPALL